MNTTLAELAAGLASNPTAWLLALALMALAYMYRQRTIDQKDLLAMVIAQEAAHRETILKIVPIAEKLTSSVEVLERITTATMKEG